jgi:hypothetical protein
MTSPGVPTAPALVTIPDVELVAVGTWHSITGETTFTYDDLAEAVSALDCPGVRNPVIKLGHDEEDGSGIRWDGEPAVGWIANMQLSGNGAKINGDLTGMPAWLASVLPSAYPDRSIEMYRPFKCQIGHSHPAVITAVALLGVNHPAVGVLRSLQDVAALYEVTTTAPEPAVARATAIRHGDVIWLVSTKDTPPEVALRRLPTPIEAKAKTDFGAIQAAWMSALDKAVEDWSAISDQQRQDLTDQVQRAIDAGEFAALADLTADSADGASLLADAMTAMAESAVADLLGEADAQGVTVPEPMFDAQRLTEVARVTAALLSDSLAGAAGKRAVQVAVPGMSGADVAAKVDEHLAGLSDAFLRDNLGSALSTAQNAGRLAALDAAPTATYYASEVLDQSTCEFCAAIDGHQFESLSDAAAAYTNGGYVDCAGFLRCRGIMVAVWNEPATAASTMDRPQRSNPTIRLHIEGHSNGSQGFRLGVH